jgi:hypothetical protein
VLLWWGVGAGLAVWFSGRIRDWSVMTDELQYAKLAIAIADTHSPLPEIHGTSISVVNQLYPLLLAPLYGSLSAPEAFRAAHVLNAAVMASAAFPAYLLGRQLLARTWAVAVAALSVLVPWMVLTGFVMTEAVAYPIFLWAVVGLQRAIAAPSPRRDLLAVAALVGAVLARTQFAVLVLVLPLAILGHELGQALGSAVPGSRWRKLVAGVRIAVRRHRLLALMYASGAAALLVVAVAGSVSSLLGVYSVTVEEGSILPPGVWTASARHIDAVGIGCGLVPLILGGGWMLSGIIRPQIRVEHAFATLALLTVVVLTVEAASYDVRYGGTDVVRDRYLFYVVPLLLVAAAAALAGAPRRQVAVGSALVTVFFAATVAQLPFTTRSGLWVDAPAQVLNDFLEEQSGALGTGTFVAFAGLLLGLALALGVLLAPRTPFAILTFAGLLVFSTLTLRTAVDRALTGNTLSGRPIAGPPGLVLDWVDAVLPKGGRAAMIPFPVTTAWDTSAIRWWDVEFWNRAVTRAYVASDGNFTYTPFPRRILAIDWSTGESTDTSDAPPYLVAAPADSRFQLAGREHAANLGLVVLAVDRPYRAVWMTRGLETDGWTKPGQPATIRVYDRRDDRSEFVDVRVVVRAPSAAPARYRISTSRGTRTGEVSGDVLTQVDVRVCVPAGSVADVAVTALNSARVEAAPLSPEVGKDRRVGVGVGPISVRPTGRLCRPPSR